MWRVIVDYSLMDAWNVIRKYTAAQDWQKINCKEKWYSGGDGTKALPGQILTLSSQVFHCIRMRAIP